MTAPKPWPSVAAKTSTIFTMGVLESKALRDLHQALKSMMQDRHPPDVDASVVLSVQDWAHLLPMITSLVQGDLVQASIPAPLPAPPVRAPAIAPFKPDPRAVLQLKGNPRSLENLDVMMQVATELVVSPAAKELMSLAEHPRPLPSSRWENYANLPTPERSWPTCPNCIGLNLNKQQLPGSWPIWKCIRCDYQRPGDW